jgi:hypothetical protein
MEVIMEVEKLEGSINEADADQMLSDDEVSPTR